MEMFLKSISASPLFVVDASIPLAEYIAININSSNKDLESFDIASSKAWEDYLSNYLKGKNKKIAYGGYLEVRDIYKRSSYFNATEDERNIHLGMDFWVDANTPILAVLDGEIHSFQNNKNFGDYGPTIILKHTINDTEFYSLYGHLSLESLKKLSEGQKIKKGEVIGYLGTNLVNGDYAPHLHFQIIKDMQGKKGDYPGVCSKKDLDFYKENCPDPNLLLKLPNEI